VIKKSVGVAYRPIDYKRAFDNVSISKIVGLLKLRSYGISGQLRSWIECFLHNRTQLTIGHASGNENISFYPLFMIHNDVIGNLIRHFSMDNQSL